MHLDVYLVQVEERLKKGPTGNRTVVIKGVDGESSSEQIEAHDMSPNLVCVVWSSAVSCTTIVVAMHL